MANDPTPSPRHPGTPWMKSLFIWPGILLALIFFVQIVDGGARGAGQGAIAYSEFLSKVDEGSVTDVAIGKEVITGHGSNGEALKNNAISDPQLTERLRAKGVKFSGQPEAQTSIWVYLL